MWMWFECRLHNVLLFGIRCLLLHEVWRVRTQTLVCNRSKRLLGRWNSFAMYSFKYLLASRRNPAMSLFPLQGSYVLRKLKLFTRVRPSLVHAHGEETCGRSSYFLSYFQGWLLRDSSLGFPNQGFEGSTRFIVSRYCVWVSKRCYIY